MAIYDVHPIGTIRSELKNKEEAPLFYDEGAPEAYLEVHEPYREALDGIKPGDEVVVLTWLHQADRTVLRVHPRGNPKNPITGVFLTRSPDRPNPIGLHRVSVVDVSPGRLRIGPIEAIDGTPVVDIKAVVHVADD